MMALHCWRSHRIRRWHANPYLCDRHQNLADHSWGVATLIMHLHPAPSAALIGRALLHDAGESATGDVPRPAKEASPELRKALRFAESRAAEAQMPEWMRREILTKQDRKWIGMADKLEAILWACHQGDVRGEGWGDLTAEVVKAAASLGVEKPVAALIQEAVA